MIPLSEVADVVEASGRGRPSIATVHRWASHGLSGVRLRATYGVGRRHTKPEWVEKFFADVERARWGEPSAPTVTLGERQRQHAAADAELELMLGA